MRTVVLGISVLFVALLAALTLIDVSQHGVSALAVISLLILIVLITGLIGAIRTPPRQ